MQIATISNVIQSTVAAAERVYELLDEAEEIPESDTPTPIEGLAGSVRLEDVSFRYDPEVPLIERMSIEATPGSVTAIVGPTGAGKTTLVNLLMRFYELDSGTISIDGVSTVDLARSTLRGLFGMVLQDAWLFSGSIRENIAYGRDDATEAEIVAAAEIVHADHFVRTLPEGYDTVINEEASNISQGQKQLLTIARAVLADPTILILDEATSNVDTRTEAFVQKAMTRLMSVARAL
jgi:ATP-binding cassette subfamily B multidrug efflux pump